MDQTGKLTNKVLHYLNENVNYALLRNYEELPFNNDSRDIDIIIEKKELLNHQTAILNVIIESGWKIVNQLNNGRLITFVCGIIHDNKVELLQWDFFLHTSIHGVTLIDAKEMLEEREFNGILYHVSKTYEFLDKYVYNRAAGEQYPLKYQSTREEVGKSQQTQLKLKNLFGDENIEVIDKMPKNKLLKKVLLDNLKTDFFRSIGRIINSQWLYLSSFLSSSAAVRVGFTGPDGAGKTTVIEFLQKEISTVFGKATEYYHFRPYLIPNLGEVAHSSGIKKEVDKEYDKPHRSTKKGMLNSFVRLCYYTLDYIIGFWVEVKPHCRLTKFVIFDRYFTDIISDSRRSSIHLNPQFLYYWGKVFIPKMNYNILLTADRDIILARKQELDKNGVDDINSKLKYLSNKKGYYLIENNGTADEAVQKILSIVLEMQHMKNLKRLKY